MHGCCWLGGSDLARKTKFTLRRTDLRCVARICGATQRNLGRVAGRYTTTKFAQVHGFGPTGQGYPKVLFNVAPAGGEPLILERFDRNFRELS